MTLHIIIKWLALFPLIFLLVQIPGVIGIKSYYYYYPGHKESWPRVIASLLICIGLMLFFNLEKC